MKRLIAVLIAGFALLPRQAESQPPLHRLRLRVGVEASENGAHEMLFSRTAAHVSAGVIFDPSIIPQIEGTVFADIGETSITTADASLDEILDRTPSISIGGTLRLVLLEFSTRSRLGIEATYLQMVGQNGFNVTKLVLPSSTPIAERAMWDRASFTARSWQMEGFVFWEFDPWKNLSLRPNVGVEQFHGELCTAFPTGATVALPALAKDEGCRTLSHTALIAGAGTELKLSPHWGITLDLASTVAQSPLLFFTALLEFSI